MDGVRSSATGGLYELAPGGTVSDTAQEGRSLSDQSDGPLRMRVTQYLGASAAYKEAAYSG